MPSKGSTIFEVFFCFGGFLIIFLRPRNRQIPNKPVDYLLGPRFIGQCRFAPPNRQASLLYKTLATLSGERAKNDRPEGAVVLNQVRASSLRSQGEPRKRPAKRFDSLVQPYTNEQAARYANKGFTEEFISQRIDGTGPKGGEIYPMGLPCPPLALYPPLLSLTPAEEFILAAKPSKENFMEKFQGTPYCNPLYCTYPRVFGSRGEVQCRGGGHGSFKLSVSVLSGSVFFLRLNSLPPLVPPTPWVLPQAGKFCFPSSLPAP